MTKYFDAEEFRKHAHQMVDFIANYHRDIESFLVRSQVEVCFVIFALECGLSLKAKMSASTEILIFLSLCGCKPFGSCRLESLELRMLSILVWDFVMLTIVRVSQFSARLLAEIAAWKCSRSTRGTRRYFGWYHLSRIPVEAPNSAYVLRGRGFWIRARAIAWCYIFDFWPSLWNSALLICWLGADVQSKIVPGVTHWQSPSFFGYYPSNGSTAGFLGEMLSGGFNVMGFSWMTSPAATELEIIVLDWLGKLLQLPNDFLSSGNNNISHICGLNLKLILGFGLCNICRILSRPLKGAHEVTRSIRLAFIYMLSNNLRFCKGVCV